MSKRAYTAAVVNSFDPERENSTGEKVRYLERLGFLRVLHVVNRASCTRQEEGSNGFARNCCFHGALQREEKKATGGIGFFDFSQAWRMVFVSNLYTLKLTKSAPLNALKYSIKKLLRFFFKRNYPSVIRRKRFKAASKR